MRMGVLSTVCVVLWCIGGVARNVSPHEEHPNKMYEQPLNNRSSSHTPSYPTAYMDDTTCIAHLDDVPFIFAYINTYGPPLGLKLSQDKCEIRFGTHDLNPFQTFPIDIVTGLVWAVTWATSTFCKNQHNFSGFVPIGGPIYTTTLLAQFST
jgi:hypothetical protein